MLGPSSVGSHIMKTIFQREDWGRRVGRAARGRAKMDRPVVGAQEHNNDDLVEYLLSMKQWERGRGRGTLRKVWPLRCYKRFETKQRKSGEVCC